MKQTKLLAICLLFFSSHLFAQCLTAPVFPACTGSETLVVANDNITVGQTKYFYGTPATLSNVRLSGGTLVVCGDLTLTEMMFDSGVVFVRPAATLVVNNASGLIVKGNTAIYNAGIFQCLGNFVMDGSYASASKPNIFINTNLSSWLKMQNQYFVINNPYSKIINNGIADFHGLITDPQAAAGSVCLGNNSQTRMTVLYNRAKHPYIAPVGTACVSVTQYSQFYDTLTIYPNINFCLSPLHTSDATCIPWGCKPNAWGAGQVTNNCSNCTSLLSVMAVNFKKINATAYADHNEITWEMSGTAKRTYLIQRSFDGVHFSTIDSIKNGSGVVFTYKDPVLKSISYYKVAYANGSVLESSNVVVVKRMMMQEVYPNPFTSYITIPLKHSRKPSFSMMDVNGRKVKPGKIIVNGEKLLAYFDQLPKGMYILSVEYDNERFNYKIMKK